MLQIRQNISPCPSAWHFPVLSLWCQCAEGFECQSAPVPCLWTGYAQGFGVSHIDRTPWLRNASGLGYILVGRGPPEIMPAGGRVRPIALCSGRPWLMNQETLVDVPMEAPAS